MRSRNAGIHNPLSVWSAGCSSGDEPYTLAMVLSEFAEKSNGFRFSILATDLSTAVLEKAQAGINTKDKIEPVPMPLRKKYLLKSKDSKKGLVRIVPELRRLIEFRKLNLMDDDFKINRQVDIIFCRNVIIYFNQQTQETLINKFARHLSPDGFLFMGHSETLSGLKVPFTATGKTIYRNVHWLKRNSAAHGVHRSRRRFENVMG